MVITRPAALSALRGLLVLPVRRTLLLPGARHILRTAWSRTTRCVMRVQRQQPSENVPRASVASSAFSLKTATSAGCSTDPCTLSSCYSSLVRTQSYCASCVSVKCLHSAVRICAEKLLYIEDERTDPRCSSDHKFAESNRCVSCSPYEWSSAAEAKTFISLYPYCIQLLNWYKSICETALSRGYVLKASYYGSVRALCPCPPFLHLAGDPLCVPEGGRSHAASPQRV